MEPDGARTDVKGPGQCCAIVRCPGAFDLPLLALMSHMASEDSIEFIQGINSSYTSQQSKHLIERLPSAQQGNGARQQKRREPSPIILGSDSEDDMPIAKRRRSSASPQQAPGPAAQVPRPPQDTHMRDRQPATPQKRQRRTDSHVDEEEDLADVPLSQRRRFASPPKRNVTAPGERMLGNGNPGVSFMGRFPGATPVLPAQPQQRQQAQGRSASTAPGSRASSSGRPAAQKPTARPSIPTSRPVAPQPASMQVWNCYLSGRF